MSWMMRHGLGDCTPERHCGCLTPVVPNGIRVVDLTATIVTQPVWWYWIPLGVGWRAVHRVLDGEVDIARGLAWGRRQALQAAKRAIDAYAEITNTP